MKPAQCLSSLLLAAALTAPATVSAFTVGGDNGVALHGSVQADVLFPEDDKAINTDPYDKDILFNTYADLNMISRYVDAGVRLEFMKWPLPGYEHDFAGWGVPNIYVKGRYNGFEVTAGDFYEQFGSGFILRTYQERSLGIDNSIRGGRLKINALRGFNFTILGGLQRRYWDWKKQSQVYGGDMEVNFSELSKSLADRGIGWTFGASYVLKRETKGENIEPDGTDYRLRIPKNVNAFDLRSNFRKGNFGVLGEFAWKSQDPSFDNSYTYGNGTAAMLSGSYSRSGMSVLLQAKRSENMSFRSQRDISGTSAFLNNMPAFAYQHTYSLPALYPYATQAADGEWAFQGSFAYTFKRKTALGGKYGTKIKVNASYIRGLDRKAPTLNMVGTLQGTDGYKSAFFKMGAENYHDFNVQIEKKLTRSYNLSFMYMNQMVNNDVLKIAEVDGTHRIHTNIFVLDGKWSIDRRYTLRTELQYLSTPDDQKDWAYGLVELSVAPYLMFTLSDMWNCGDTGTHYYMGGVTGNFKSNRLMVSYGRTRAGFNCSGGVCRQVPSTRGFQIAYTYNF